MSQKKAKKTRRETDPKKIDQAKLKEALDNLTPEEAEMFVSALELAMKKRNIMLVGYIAAIIGLLVGIGAAFTIYGMREPGQFVGWAFLIPPALAAAALIGFGKWSRSLKK